MILVQFSAFSQNEQSEFPELIFEGTLISVTPTNKAHQSYIFTMSVDKLIKGKYKEKEISFECYAGFGGNELLEYFQCDYENADSVFNCKGTGCLVLYERDYHGTIIYLFGSINPIEATRKSKRKKR